MESRLKVIINNLENNPQCSHGPTILFAKTYNSQKTEEYFACSACRDRKQCSFYLKLKDLKKFSSVNKLNVVSKIDHKKCVNKLQKILELNCDQRAYCFTCQELILDIEISDHIKHRLKQGITNNLLKEPTKLLCPLSNDKKEAQYFFADSTLKFFVTSFQSLQFTKIICIGTPRLHEYLKTNTNMSSILLDFDKRFHSFYSETEYIWYNMFNNHFFGENESIENFANFLNLQNEMENICVVTDPPFGCRTELLVETIRKISSKYRLINNTTRILPIMWIFPYFMENYIINLMPEMEMINYKINYINHELYSDGVKGRKQGSPVRIFTNIPNSQIKLPANEGYKYCSKCLRWITLETVHCRKCENCLSKNGDRYIHCNYCELCVKPNYKHCHSCGRCTQKVDHNCKTYQENLICWICRKKGHTENKCENWLKLSKNKNNLIIKNKLRICLICNNKGHNEKNCTKRELILKEKYFLGNYENMFLKLE